MQNDVLKNKTVPWQEKGRWYHGTIDLTTLQYDQDKTDDFLIQHASTITSSSNAVVAHFDSPNIRAIESRYIPDENFRPAINSYIANGSYYLAADGAQFPSVGPYGNVGKLEFWIFIVEL